MVYVRTVRLADTDAAGVIYFASALSICHEAYEDSLAQAGVNFQQLLQGSLALPIVHAEIDFFAPVFCGNILEVELFPTLETSEQFSLRYEIFFLGERERSVVRALTRHVAIELATRKRTNLPEQIINWLGI
jgi:1,4-dihydroxy-2-naphthoyl-CoA hydrolase